MIPLFPAFKEIGLEDHAEIIRHLTACQPATSELSFTSLFIWRHQFRTAWSQYGRWLLFLEERADDSHYFLPPVGEGVGPALIQEMLDWLHSAAHEAEPAIERADSRLVSLLGDQFNVEPMPEHFDYIYRRQALSELSGPCLRKKRNQASRLSQATPFIFEKLRAEHIPECYRVSEEWKVWRKDRGEALLTSESQVVHEALRHFEYLPVQGGVLLVRDQVEAFAIGERLNHNTLVIHIEKATPRLPGLFTLINQQMSERCGKEIEWINRAQDLGIAGIRRSKRSWHPDHLVQKFRIRLL